MYKDGAKGAINSKICVQSYTAITNAVFNAQSTRAIKKGVPPDSNRELVGVTDRSGHSIMPMPDLHDKYGMYRPTVATVNLACITNNVQVLKQHLGSSRKNNIMAVVKADGYGHGAFPVCEAAIRGGVYMCVFNFI